MEIFKPGPDGNAGDCWDEDPRADRGDDAMTGSHTKRSIRNTF